MYVHAASSYRGINRRWLGEAVARLLKETDIAGRHLKMPRKYIFFSPVPVMKYLRSVSNNYIKNHSGDEKSSRTICEYRAEQTRHKIIFQATRKN
jgi:hypothetical protein